ncbi:MAG: hypothetical protein AAB036_02380 [Elusimicrobiota bacterium]
MRIFSLLAACCLLSSFFPCAARAQEAYGARGLFPVYQSGEQWLIFDKPRASSDQSAPLLPGTRFLVVGSSGANLFVVARSSPTYGAVCRDKRSVRLRAALLKGSRSAVGDPVIAIKVSESFDLQGSKAKYKALDNVVDEALYRAIGSTLAAVAVEEVKSGAFRFRSDDEGADVFKADPQTDKVTMKIDFAANVRVSGLTAAKALVTGAQISASYRRCLRLLDGAKLVGSCVPMPHDLMAETSQLRFISYDPGGKGSPLLLAYSRGEPLWGHERWGFVLRPSGAQLFLRDALNPKCREGF